MRVPYATKVTGRLSRLVKSFFGAGFKAPGGIFGSFVPPDDANIPNNSGGYRKAYKENVWVRRCCDIRASNLSSVPIILVDGKPTEDGAYSRIDDHPILDLLNNVNDQTMNKIDLFKATSLDCDLDGMSAWLILKGTELERSTKVAALPRRGRPPGKGSPTEIYRLDPSRLELVPSNQPGKFLSHYKYRVDIRGQESKFVEYSTDEIVLFKVFNPEDEYKGLSLVHSVRKYVSADINALNWNANFFTNASHPGNVIIFPDPLKPDQRRDVEDVLNKYHSGVGKVHGNLILGGNPKFQDKGITPKDADWTSLSMTNRDSICAGLGVPVFLVSGNDSSRYDTADPQKASFWEESLLPELAWWAEVLNWSLVKMYPDLVDRKAKLMFDVSDIPALKAVTLARYQKVITATGTPFLSPNEGRAVVGKGPVEGGEKILIPLGVIPIDAEDLEYKANAKVFGHDDEQQARHETSTNSEENNELSLGMDEEDMGMEENEDLKDRRKQRKFD